MKKAIFICSVIVMMSISSGCSNVVFETTNQPALAYDEDNEEKSTILQIPRQEDIKAVQIGNNKLESKSYGGRKLEILLNQIENAQLTDEGDAPALDWQNASTNDYVSVIFHLQGKDKTKFFFYQWEGHWYFETENNVIYDGSFFAGEIQDSESDLEVGQQVDMQTEQVQTNPLPGVELLNYLNSSGMQETRYKFLYYLNQKIESGYSKEEAVGLARKEMIEEWQLYQYAKTNGYELTKEEKMSLQEEELDELKKVSEFAEIKTYFESNNISFDEVQNKLFSVRMDEKIIDHMIGRIKKDFYDGKDTIKKKECWTDTEYLDLYLTEIIIPETENYNTSALYGALEDAESFYFEYYVDIL